MRNLRAMFALICAGNFLLHLGNALPIEQENSNEICASPACTDSSREILARMDRFVNPCDNFYKFACGNFLANAVIPKDKDEINLFTILEDKLDLQLKTLLEEPAEEGELDVFRKMKIFYRNCMDTENVQKEGVNAMRKIFEDMGGWPLLLGDAWNSSGFDWKQQSYKLNDIGFGTGHFIYVIVDTDMKNNSRRIIYVAPPQFGIEDEYLKKGKNDAIVRAYHKYMTKLAVIFGASEERAAAETEEILDFEIILANQTLSAEQRRNKNKVYNNLTLEELQLKYPSIPWVDYINKILPKNVRVDKDEVVVVTDPNYLGSLGDVFHNTSARTVANYLLWKILSLSADYLTDEILRINLEFNEILTGIKELESRWKKCVGDVTLTMPNLVGALYIRRHFGEESKSEILDMLRYLRAEFNRSLKENDWMDEETKEAALNKLRVMMQHVAYPDELLDDDVLTKFYGEMNVVPDEYLASALSVNRFLLNFDYARLRKLVNKTEWISHGNTANINAYFSQVENAILLPAGILQGHFFGPGRPKYLNFGAFGSIIGHEITHAFDDVGRQFDSGGNLKEWWRKDAKEAFLKKTGCIIEQYRNYSVPEVNLTINGVITQGENIADNSGVRAAYAAYLSWKKRHGPEPGLPDLNYTANQMFFISMAQSLCGKTTLETLRHRVEIDNHCPSEYRVVVPFGNLPEFSEDFRCPLGCQMNPVNKCKVW